MTAGRILASPPALCLPRPVTTRRWVLRLSNFTRHSEQQLCTLLTLWLRLTNKSAHKTYLLATDGR